MTTGQSAARVSRADEQTTGTAGLRSPDRPAVWLLVAAVELAAAAAAAVADWFIRAVVLVAMAGVSLLLLRHGPGFAGFHRPRRPWRLVGQMAAFCEVTAFRGYLLTRLTDGVRGGRCTPRCWL